MYCALAILAVGILAQIGRGGAALQAAGWLFLLGSLIFSGSLYVLAVTGLRWLGAITPIGGACDDRGLGGAGGGCGVVWFRFETVSAEFFSNSWR